MEPIHSIPYCESILADPKSTVKDKYETLFHLKSHGSNTAVSALIKSYVHLRNSELLKHELMYILGQINNDMVVDFLIEVLNNHEEAPVVRHEAGEALANYSSHKSRILKELKKFIDSDISVLRSTVRIAITKLTIYGPNNNYQKYLEGNIEPADPFTESELQSYLDQKKVYHEDLLCILLDPELDEFIKYKIMYYLRDKGNEPSILTLFGLLDAKNRKGTTPLLRHEVCFILGQLQGKADYEFVKKGLYNVINDPSEESIVRHEAILSYSDIWGCSDLVDILNREEERLITESLYIVMN